MTEKIEVVQRTEQETETAQNADAEKTETDKEIREDETPTGKITVGSEAAEIGQTKTDFAQAKTAAKGRETSETEIGEKTEGEKENAEQKNPKEKTVGGTAEEREKSARVEKTAAGEKESRAETVVPNRPSSTRRPAPTPQTLRTKLER